MTDQSTALDGKVSVATGAGQGLGRAEALALAGGGARLVLNDLPGQVFVVYGGAVAVMAPPSAAYLATTEGLWTPGGLAAELGPHLSTGTSGFSAAEALTFS